MSEKHPKADKGTLNQETQYRRSFVDPGCHEQCFSNKIASIKCEVLQPQPKSPVYYIVAASHASRPETLLPSEIRLLCLWKSKEENEYHLTVIKEDKDQVFLDLPLSKLLNGEISYNINRQWHEVTVLSDRPQQPRRFVFRLESSSADHADCKDFNRHLETVFEEILQSGVGRENNTVTLSSSADQNGAQLGGGASLTQTTAPVPPVAMAELSSAASSEMASRQPMSKPQVTFPAKDVEQMALTLATSIRTGDVQRAMRFATLLAQAQTNLTVNYDVAAEEEKAREQEISATVVVEDREMACLPLDIKVKPSDTISDLKRSFWDKHGFPVEVQKWIIGKRIPGDEETLSKCDITSSGHTLYLYLLNIRAVDPASRGDANRQYWQGQSSAGNAGGNTASRSKQDSDYETMTFPIAPVSGTPLRGASTHSLSSVDLTLSSSQQQRNQGLLLPLTSTGGAAEGTARQQSQLSATSSSASLSAVSFGLPDIRGNLEPLSGPTSAQQQRGGMEVVLNGVGQMVLTGGGGVGVSENHPLQGSPVDGQPSQELESAQGWQCPQCTLINQPTRPGCEACGSPRPPGYQVPSDFIVSEEERHRLERERQMEAFLKQTSGQHWPREWGGRGQQQRGGATNTNTNNTSPTTTTTTTTTTTNPPLSTIPSQSSAKEKLTPEQLDLILRFNDAIQEHLAPQPQPSLVTEREGSSVDHQELLRFHQRLQSLNDPRAVAPPSGAREPVQNAELGEDVVDGVPLNNLIGWGSSDEDEESSRA
ncbi:hypothetical protein ACOMHN_032186 [Nucella lapillus]